MLYGIKDSANLSVISNKSGKPVLYADYCNKTDIEFSSTPTYATRKGVKSISWDGAREGKMTTEMQVFDLKWVALLMGTEFTKGTFTINRHEVLDVKSAKATLKESPKAGSLMVFKANADGTEQLDEQLVGTPATQVNTYSIADKVITLNGTTFATDGKIIVYYLVDSGATGESFTVTATDFPQGYQIVGDTQIRDASNVDHLVQFYIGNCKPQSNISLSMNSDDVTTLSITWDILADGNGDMFTWKNL